MNRDVSTETTKMAELLAAAERSAATVLDRCEQLGAISEDTDCLTRTFCSDAMRKAHGMLRGWMVGAGLECRVDGAGNLIGTLAATKEDERRRYLVGSHLDSVVDAGKYDGVLGVLLALGMVELLNAQQATLPFAVDVLAFSEEEGVRFHTPFIGSRAIAGTFPDEWLERIDENGVTIRGALEGFDVDPDQMPAAAYDPNDVLGFLEPHIEQGPVLESENLPLGIVETVAGQTRALLRLDGTAGHAGTVPMDRRHDALTAAALLITFVERLGRDTTGLYATTGCIDTRPNIANVIPSRVNLQIDVRHASDSVRNTAVSAIEQHGNEIASERGLRFSVKWTESHDATAMDPSMNDALMEAIAEIGLTPKRLVSGAGHDAVAMSDLTATAILFLRCRGGISHHPDEAVEVADVAWALATMVGFIMKQGRK